MSVPAMGRGIVLGTLALLSPLAAQPTGDRAIKLLPASGQPKRLEARHALVIGNNAYQGSPLRNAVNDARGMETTLRELGFEVELATDVNRRAAEEAVERFIHRLGPGTIGLFFYAGHGIQVEGENYLLPVDYSARSEEEARYQGLAVGLVHDRMLKSKARMSVLVMDACRDNPFRTTRGGHKGLASMSAGKGSFVAFATAPGATASDEGAGSNGLFTACLLEALRQPDLGLNDVFDRARELVDARSAGRQLPWTASSVVGGFVFRDLAIQELRVEAEQRRLEAELARLAQVRAAAGQRLGEQAKREQGRREQELLSQLQLENLEKTRLVKERERRQLLEAERQRQEQAISKQIEAREAAHREETGRLEAIKQRLAAETTSVRALQQEGLTVEAALKEVATLGAQLAALEQTLATEQSRALAQVDLDYADPLARTEKALVKDAFETTAQFQARVDAQASERRSLEARRTTDRRESDSRTRAAGAGAQAALGAQIAELKGRGYPVQGVQAELGVYDADTQAWPFRLQVNGAMVGTGILRVAPEQARAVDAHKAFLKVEATQAFGTGKPPALKSAALIDPVLGPLTATFTLLTVQDHVRVATLEQLRPFLRAKAKEWGGKSLGWFNKTGFTRDGLSVWSEADRMKESRALVENAAAVAVLGVLQEDASAARSRLGKTRNDMYKWHPADWEASASLWLDELFASQADALATTGLGEILKLEVFKVLQEVFPAAGKPVDRSYSAYTEYNNLKKAKAKAKAASVVR